MTTHEAVDRLGRYTMSELLNHCRDRGIKGGPRPQQQDNCVVHDLIREMTGSFSHRINNGFYKPSKDSEYRPLPPVLADLEAMYERTLGNTHPKFRFVPALPPDLIAR